MQAASLVALVIENNPDLVEKGKAILGSAGIRDIDVIRSRIGAIGYLRQRRYDIIIANEMADTLLQEVEYILDSGGSSFFQDALRKELQANNNTLIGLYTTESYKSVWRRLTPFVFPRERFYGGDALQQVLNERFGIG